MSPTKAWTNDSEGKALTLTETDSGLVVARAWEGEWRVLANENEIHSLNDKNVLEVRGGDSCVTLRKH